MSRTATSRTGRAPSERRRLWRLRLGIAVVITVLGALFAVAAFTPVIGVRSVRVEGARQISAAQVLRVAGVKRGTPLLRVNSSAIVTRVLRLPVVASVSVSESLPSTVKIKIVERQAVAYRPDGAVFRLLDKTGFAFRTGLTVPAGLPKIEVTDGDSAALQATTTVAAGLGQSLLRKTASIAASSAQTVTLTLSDGRVLFWGGTDRAADKVRLVPALLTQPGGYFDLSDPDAVISRPAA